MRNIRENITIGAKFTEEKYNQLKDAGLNVEYADELYAFNEHRPDIRIYENGLVINVECKNWSSNLSLWDFKNQVLPRFKGVRGQRVVIYKGPGIDKAVYAEAKRRNIILIHDDGSGAIGNLIMLILYSKYYLIERLGHLHSSIVIRLSKVFDDLRRKFRLALASSINFLSVSHLPSFVFSGGL